MSDPDGTVVDEIVVNGARYPTTAFWNGRLIAEDCEAWANFYDFWENEVYDPYAWGSENLPAPNYPPTFDRNLDKVVDKIARQIGAEIKLKPDYSTREYGAIIWKDISGAVHRTSVEPGKVNMWNPASVWSQIGGGGKVLSLVHSHPSLYNASSEANPIWLPLQDAKHLSSGDFDQLLRYSGMISGFDAPSAGFDSDNYRSYLVWGEQGNVHEFYGFDQDVTRYDGSADASWAQPSSDFVVNAYGP